MPDEGTARPVLEAFHLPVTDGQRFCILHAPPGAPAHDDRVLTAGRAPAIVYVHPFGEEMNKSRRMAALQARALAANGWTVLQIDLAGCGDSDGDFAGTSWERWIADVVEGAQWLRERTGCVPWLWGLRAGCLLAAEAASASATTGVAGLLFWQPVLSGQQHLRQFLRLVVAAEALAPDEGGTGDQRGSSAARASTDALRDRLLSGSILDVAGYTLGPAVAAGLDAARLDAARLGAARPDADRLAPANSASSPPVVWIEVTGGASVELTPASRTEVDRWRTAGRTVDARAVTGPAFWQTQEIEESAELIRETLAALASADALRSA